MKPCRSLLDIIRKYSGEWAAARFIESYDRSDELALEQLKSDPKRGLVLPSSADQDRARNAFNSVVTEWLGEKPNHPLLLREVESELAKLRSIPATTQ